jgi:hypothetical protein
MKKLSEPILSDIISIDWRHYPKPCRGVHRNSEKKRDRYISDDEYRAV